MSGVKRVCRKLCSQRGESLAEVLIALLVSILSVLLLGGMIAASSRIIDRSTLSMQERYGRTNAVRELPSSVSWSVEENPSQAGTFIVYNYKVEDDVVYYGPAS